MIRFNDDQAALLRGDLGEAAAMSMRILADMARVDGVHEFIPVTSAHIDGCLYHGDTGCYYAERLQQGGGRVRVPSSLNVGAMDMCSPSNVLLEGQSRDLAIRQMNAYLAMGCVPSWTCAPYQAGFRPSVGEQVAWAESNAVVFANSVLGARTNRYGDFLDICCAITGYVPNSGLHLDENRFATIRVGTAGLPPELKQRDDFYPVLGSWLGREVGSDVAVIDGLPESINDDQLKALGAAAASTGSVALFHVRGVTPEAPDLESASGGGVLDTVIELDASMLLAEHGRMSSAADGAIDLVALGSPHFSIDEFESLRDLLAGRTLEVPIYVCTGRHAIDALEQRGWRKGLEDAGLIIIADTCVVVTPVIRQDSGVLMTNSGKFAHYSTSLTGHEVVFGGLDECVESAVAGRVCRNPGAWGA